MSQSSASFPGNAVLAPGSGWTIIRELSLRPERWQTLEARSRQGLPFELKLEWSSGGGSGALAFLSVSSATRVSIYAASLRVSAANPYTKTNDVVVACSDGYVPSSNQWEVRGTLEGEEVSLEVPPFATHVRIEMASVPSFTDAEIRVYDGSNELRSVTPGPQQPAGGIPLGGASKVGIAALESTAFRAIFQLSL